MKIILSDSSLCFYVVSKLSTTNIIIPLPMDILLSFQMSPSWKLCATQAKGKEEERVEEQVESTLVLYNTNLVFLSAPRPTTTPHRSNPGFPKFLAASLLAFLLLLAVSLLVAFFSEYSSGIRKQRRSLLETSI